ncbi:MAG: LysR family transcriptional regulator [Paracoccaceae bacterium]
MSINHIPNIGARQLVAVLAIAETGSFVAAAAQLQMSQPALTRTIKRVEDVLGVRLFERTTRQVRLTDAGREFVALAQRMTNDLKIAARSMRELADQQRGQVIVASLMSIAQGVLPNAIGVYRRVRPGIEIQVRDGIHASVLEDIKSGAADFGVTYLQHIPEGVLTTRLGQGHFDLVASRGSDCVAPRTESIRFDELREVPLASMPQGSQTRRVLEATAAVRGFTLTHAAVVSQIPTLLSFVRARVGVGLVPSASITGDLVRLSVRDPQILLDIGILQLAERALSPAAEGLMEVIATSWLEHYYLYRNKLGYQFAFVIRLQAAIGCPKRSAMEQNP